MKKLLTILLLINFFSTYAVEFKQSFYDLLDKGDLELAEIFLQQWESNDNGNPDLFLAKFNLLLSKAFQTTDNSNSNSDIAQSNAWMVLEPSDSILQLAIEAIKKGVEVFPNRLDFRLAEAQAYQYAEDQESLSNLGIDILEYSRVNGCQWDWTDGVALNAEDGLKNMLDGIHTIEYSLNYNPYQENLLKLNLKYYPMDAEALLFKGMSLIDMDNNEEACSCLQYAHDLHPADDAIMFYLAVAYYNMGNVDKEKEMLNKIIACETADENIKKTAQSILDKQDSDYREIDLYKFEFNFLRDVAASCPPSEKSIEFLINKDDELFYALEQLGFYLPEEKKAIKIDVIGEGDEAIVVWSMPYPEEMPLASYIAFVPDKEANNYRLYTLERSLNWDGIEPLWILGYTYKDGHSNFGDIPYPSTPEEFVSHVIKVMKSKK